MFVNAYATALMANITDQMMVSAENDRRAVLKASNNEFASRRAGTQYYIYLHLPTQ